MCLMSPLKNVTVFVFWSAEITFLVPLYRCCSISEDKDIFISTELSTQCHIVYDLKFWVVYTDFYKLFLVGNHVFSPRFWIILRKMCIFNWEIKFTMIILCVVINIFLIDTTSAWNLVSAPQLNTTIHYYPFYPWKSSNPLFIWR